MNEAKVKAKRKNLLNLIDVFLVILIVLALAGFISYRFILADNTAANVELEYKINVRNVSEDLNTSKLLNDPLYNKQGVLMGTVSECGQIQCTEHSIEGENATYVQTTAHFTVTVRTKAVRMKDGSYRVNGLKLFKGDMLTLTSTDFTVVGDCIEISEVSK